MHVSTNSTLLQMHVSLTNDSINAHHWRTPITDYHTKTLIIHPQASTGMLEGLQQFPSNNWCIVQSIPCTLSPSRSIADHLKCDFDQGLHSDKGVCRAPTHTSEGFEVFWQRYFHCHLAVWTHTNLAPLPTWSYHSPSRIFFWFTPSPL